jgi:hypothetical protein
LKIFPAWLIFVHKILSRFLLGFYAQTISDMFRAKVLIFLLPFISGTVYGQDTLQRFIFFPDAMHNTWSYSLGFTFTTTPQPITEETHISAPAIDFHALRSAGNNFNLNARTQIQVLQNHISVGFQWVHSATDRLKISAGDELAGWVGWIKIETINTRGYGILNYPNLSVGYKFDEELLLTLKAELLLNFYQRFFVGEQVIEEDPSLYSGEAFSIMLEQPFFKDTWLTLGFRAMYSNFFWQTWSLFEDYDRNIFYPELTAAFIL